ncbi:helix-turn-helix domain-containing protein [Marvinbryantia formatexigens]|nr:helix-turn-helix transcriptional regulator [Marvinbryantia formatexigens]
MKKKGITQYKLIKEHNFSAGQLSRLRANAYVNTHTIDVLCQILDCKVQDIMQFEKNLLDDHEYKPEKSYY